MRLWLIILLLLLESWTFLSSFQLFWILAINLFSTTFFWEINIFFFLIFYFIKILCEKTVYNITFYLYKLYFVTKNKIVLFCIFWDNFAFGFHTDNLYYCIMLMISFNQIRLADSQSKEKKRRIRLYNLILLLLNLSKSFWRHLRWHIFHWNEYENWWVVLHIIRNL